MHAKQGDQIVIDTTTLDALRRHGEVIEVIGQGEREHYRIRWQDGHESVYFPGPDARVVSAAWAARGHPWGTSQRPEPSRSSGGGGSSAARPVKIRACSALRTKA
jgi:hypothetical protein